MDTHQYTLSRIRISKHIWNAYKPPTCILIPHSKPRCQRSAKARAKVRKAIYTTAHDDLRCEDGDALTKRQITKPSSSRVRSCKVKLWRFNYGGSKRTGTPMTESGITLDIPCLLPACKTCLQWHPHLLRDEAELVDEIHVQRKGPTESAEMRTTSPPYTVNDMLPQYVHTRSNEGRILRLLFPSSEGKQRYEALVRDRERRQLLEKECIRNNKARCRYRVKLVFGSQSGRARYKELLEAELP